MKFIVPIINLFIFSQHAFAKEYVTQQGDNLHKIIRLHIDVIKNADINQLIPVIVKANPHAFLNNNPNKLRIGERLTIPVEPRIGIVRLPEG